MKKEHEISQIIHNLRGELNRISMQSELVNLVLENDMPKEKAISAAKKIIDSCQGCSAHLESLTKTAKGED